MKRKAKVRGKWKWATGTASSEDTIEKTPPSKMELRLRKGEGGEVSGSGRHRGMTGPRLRSYDQDSSRQSSQSRVAFHEADDSDKDSFTSIRLLRSHRKVARVDTPSDRLEVSSGQGEESAALSIQAMLELGIFQGRILECRDKYGNILITGVVNAEGLIEYPSTSGRGKQAVRFNVFEAHAGQAHSRGQQTYLCNGTSLKEFVLAINTGFVDSFVREDLHELTGSSMAKDKVPDNKSTLAKATMKFAMSKYDEESRFNTIACKTLRKKCRKGRNSNKNKQLFTEEDSILKNGEKVVYKTAQNDILLRGVIEKPGILCACCTKVISCSQFEAHAGRGSRRAPYENIYLDSGLSLKALAESVSGNQSLVPEGNHACMYSRSLNCSYCQGKGGMLLTCDACPKVYHVDCMGISLKDQESDWLCMECKAGSSSFSSKSRKRQVVARCTSLLRELDAITGGCVLCHLPDFSRGKFCSWTSILCDQCEREFHVGCLEKNKICSLKSIPKGDWFCSSKCKEVHHSLQKISGGTFNIPGPYECEIFGRDRSDLESHALDEALSILQESFDPLVDFVTGVDLLPKMVHAETFNDHDYTNIHTILLKHGARPVCAAVLRICGPYVAELPFIATKMGARKQGHCRKMMEIIHGMLSALSVNKLCLPAADKAMDTWIRGFGFHVMDDDQFRQTKADFRILVFPGTTVLAKDIITRPKRGNTCMNMFLKFV